MFVCSSKFNNSIVAMVVQWLVCLPLDPNVAGSNPTKVTDF
jgi:hypothetical protein